MRPSLCIIVISLLFSSCDPAAPADVDSSYVTPVLADLRLSIGSVDTDTILTGPERLPDDLITIRFTASFAVVSGPAVTEITASLDNAEGDPIPVSVQFADNGSYPDATPGDGTYSGLVSIELLRSATGVFLFGVSGRSSNGLNSSTLWSPLSVIRANKPPVLSGLVADTLVSLSGGNTTIQLRITATDPDGREDIRRVWFDSFRPNGSAASGNPFLMYDDGNSSGISGDQTANDGIYGLTVAFGGALPGTYRFSFKGTDRSRDTSNVIDHYLTVIP